MAKSQGDRLLEVEKLATTLNERVDALRAQIASCVSAQTSTSETHAELVVKFAAVEQIVTEIQKWKEDEVKEHEQYLNLKRDVDDLRKWKDEQKKERDERSRRLWSFGPNITAAFISAVVSLLAVAVTIYLNSKK